MMGGPGYGQQMMHGIIPPQNVMQQNQPPPQQAPPQPQAPVAQQHPAQQQDDLGVKVKRSFANFDTNLKVKNPVPFSKNILLSCIVDIPS